MRTRATTFGFAALAATAVLAGCAVTPPVLGDLAPSPAATSGPACAEPGAASDSVRADGAFGDALEIEADGPFAVDRLERSVIDAGRGAVVAEGELVEVAISILNGTSGEAGPFAAPVRVLLEDGSALPGLAATIRCAAVGSRVAGVVPAADAFGDVGQPELAIGPGDDVVFVVDVLGVLPLQAAGERQDLPEGFPALDLEFAPDGRPTVGIPATDPPGGLESATLLVGYGDEVEPGDELLVQFQAVNWRTGEVFDETWGDAPRSVLDLVPGVDATLLGATVGSRVVVVCPPGDAYGSAGDATAGVLGTDTVVFVVDILATRPPPA